MQNSSFLGQVSIIMYIVYVSIPQWNMTVSSLHCGVTTRSLGSTSHRSPRARLSLQLSFASTRSVWATPFTMTHSYLKSTRWSRSTLTGKKNTQTERQTHTHTQTHTHAYNHTHTNLSFQQEDNRFQSLPQLRNARGILTSLSDLWYTLIYP